MERVGNKRRASSAQILDVVVALVVFAVYVSAFVWIPDQYSFLLLVIFVGALVYGLWVRRS